MTKKKKITGHPASLTKPTIRPRLPLRVGPRSQAKAQPASAPLPSISPTPPPAVLGAGLARLLGHLLGEVLVLVDGVEHERGGLGQPVGGHVGAHRVPGQAQAEEGDSADRREGAHGRGEGTADEQQEQEAGREHAELGQELERQRLEGQQRGEQAEHAGRGEGVLLVRHEVALVARLHAEARLRVRVGVRQVLGAVLGRQGRHFGGGYGRRRGEGLRGRGGRGAVGGGGRRRRAVGCRGGLRVLRDRGGQQRRQGQQ